MKQSNEVLIPRYLQNFNCVGAECEDTCCSGWEITIDNETYKKYKKVREPELSAIISKNIKKKRTEFGENTRKIKLDKDNNCPFLDEKKLCKIHSKLGESSLSTTCSVYPRIMNKVGEQIEISATLSCPEISRLVLLEKKPLEFDIVKNEQKSKLNIEKIIKYNHDKKLVLEDYFWDLRIFAIEILQNRDYSINERLITLGMFLNKVQNKIREKKTLEIPNLIEETKKQIDQGVVRSYISQVPVNLEIQFRFIKTLLSLAAEKGFSSVRYKQCINEFICGLDIEDKNLDIREFINGYKRIYEEFYNPYMSKNEHIFENYLVNHVFKKLFPLDQKTIFDSFVIMATHYSMIKLILIGMAGFNEGLNEEIIIKLFQSFTKEVEHNQEFSRKMLNILKKQNYNTIGYMTILINN